MMQAKQPALAGLRVIEMGQLIAGPFCGQLLGDMGAEVIKIEPPGAGDPMRQWGNAEPLWWEVIARNKKSVSLNLRDPEGQHLARRLIAHADFWSRISAPARSKTGAWIQQHSGPKTRV
jgi:crotonobetainyl-CoA:carnitine CoA-transferase CaiB-like acyl-CoA transferase